MGSRGRCIYNNKWESDPKYMDWITSVKGNKEKARCRACDCDFEIACMGESGLKSHMQSKRHQQNVKPKTTLASFGFSFNARKPAQDLSKQLSECEVSVRPDSQSTLDVAPAPTSAAVPAPARSKMFDLTDVHRAEVLWTLKLISSHYSYHSSQDSAEMFRTMFPDSQIASQFTCGERKANYVGVFGLAEHFKKLLLGSVSGPFVVLFDESLNKKLQEKQMDLHLRFWNEQLHQVQTRYLGSVFLGHATAEILMDQLLDVVVNSKLPLEEMVQMGMDGPAVNWKLFGKMKDKLKADYDVTLLNIGSCGIHIVHNSFKCGMRATGWNVGAFLSCLYYLFKDAPARREDFMKVAGTSTMPLKFSNHRWLENVPVCERAILLWDNIRVYVKAVETKKIPHPKNKSFERISECLKDPTFLAKLHYFKCIASQLVPFLTKYQTDKPMMPFMAKDLGHILRELMSRFIDRKHIKGLSDSDLMSVNIKDTAIHKGHRRIDVGFASQKLDGVQESAAMAFRLESKDCLIALLMKLLEKCPLNYSLVNLMCCLNPQLMVAKTDACKDRFAQVLTLLAKRGRISEALCETILQEYGCFLNRISEVGSERFSLFDANKDRLDVLFYETMAGKKEFGNLYDVVQILLVLSHGQASVERGFSVNKEIETANMKHRTLIAHRIICDHVRCVGGVTKVIIDKELLVTTRMARQRYHQFLDEEREKQKSVQQKTKRKRLLDEIEDSKKKRQRILADANHLQAKADCLYDKAEETNGNMLYKEANSLRRSAKEKKDRMALLDKEIDSLVSKLKEV